MMQARETWMTLMEFASARSSLIFISSEIILSLNGALKLMKKNRIFKLKKWFSYELFLFCWHVLEQQLLYVSGY